MDSKCTRGLVFVFDNTNKNNKYGNTTMELLWSTTALMSRTHIMEIIFGIQHISYIVMSHAACCL